MSSPRPTVPTTMQALVAPRYGSADVLEVATSPVPEPGAGEVLVQVAAAGASRGALHLLTGLPLLVRIAGVGLRRPKHPPVGNELAGTVVAVGDGVTRLAPGDEVFGYGRGTCAEYAVGKADKLAHRPADLPVTAAAAMVDSASTAIRAVREVAEVQAGQRVLVLGGSGGVGSYVVQLAAAEGAHVTATASTAKLDFVRSLGAEAVVDHRTTDPLAVDEPYDVIIDMGGRNPLRRLRRALTPTGALVIVGGEGGGALAGGFARQLLAPLRGIGSRQRLRGLMAVEHHRTLDTLGELAVAGTIRPPVDQVHPLADGADAFRRMEAGQICGKDVIAVIDGA